MEFIGKLLRDFFYMSHLLSIFFPILGFILYLRKRSWEYLLLTLGLLIVSGIVIIENHFLLLINPFIFKFILISSFFIINFSFLKIIKSDFFNNEKKIGKFFKLNLLFNILFLFGILFIVVGFLLLISSINKGPVSLFRFFGLMITKDGLFMLLGALLNIIGLFGTIFQKSKKGERIE